MAQQYIDDPSQQVTYESTPVRSDEIYAQMMQEDRVKNVLAQTSPDNQLADIEWRIRGYKKNYLTGQWEKINSDAPEIHPVLVSNYIAFLSSLLSDGTRFTNFSSQEINKLMKLTIEWLRDDLDTNADLYGLGGNYTERTRIGMILLNNIFVVLKRAQNGMESGRIWKSLNMTEAINPIPQKKGFLEGLKFWK